MATSVFSRWLDPEKEVPEFDPADKLLEWLTYRYRGDTIALRYIYKSGPGFVQGDRKTAFNLTKALVQRGNLVPIATHRRDRLLFHVIRDPIGLG